MPRRWNARRLPSPGKTLIHSSAHVVPIAPWIPRLWDKASAVTHSSATRVPFATSPHLTRTSWIGWIYPDSALLTQSPPRLPATRAASAMSPHLLRTSWTWLDLPGFGPSHAIPVPGFRHPRPLRFEPMSHENRLDLVGFTLDSASPLRSVTLNDRTFRRLQMTLAPTSQSPFQCAPRCSQFAFFTFHFSFFILRRPDPSAAPRRPPDLRALPSRLISVAP